MWKWTRCALKIFYKQNSMNSLFKKNMKWKRIEQRGVEKREITREREREITRERTNLGSHCVRHRRSGAVDWNCFN